MAGYSKWQAQSQLLVFDEATNSLDAVKAEHFAQTINQLKGKVTMLFISHALPKNLMVDEIVRIGAVPLVAVTGRPAEQQETSPA